MLIVFFDFSKHRRRDLQLFQYSLSVMGASVAFPNNPDSLDLSSQLTLVQHLINSKLPIPEDFINLDLRHLSARQKIAEALGEKLEVRVYCDDELFMILDSCIKHPLEM